MDEDRTVVTGGPERMVEGKYLLGTPLGAGGMGVVYAARHVGLDIPVALKVMNRVRDDLDVARFAREARAAAAIRHPNVVGVTDCGVDPDLGPYLVMELLEGQTLSAALSEEGPMPPRRAIAIAMQLLEGLAAGHERAIVHRDVKPANVFLCDREDGALHVKLLDFGTSKSMVDPRDDVTRVGTVFGTPPYLAPELLCGDPPDPRADIYAVGVLLFKMLTGESPFGELRGNALMDAVLKGCSRSLEHVRPGLPSALALLVKRAMSVEPSLRPAGALAMRGELAEIDARLAEAARPTERAVVRPKKPAQQPFPALALAALLILASGVGAGYLFSRTGTTSEGVAPASVATRSEPAPRDPPAPTATVAPRAEPAPPMATTEPQPAVEAPRPRRARARRHRIRRATSTSTATPSSASEPGYLSLATVPWAEVSEHGRSLGTTPLVGVPLSPGRHTLRLRNPELGVDESYVVEITSGETTTRRLGL